MSIVGFALYCPTHFSMQSSSSSDEDWGKQKSWCKVVQCIPLKTMAAFAVLEDIANSAIGRGRVFRDREDLLAHDDTTRQGAMRYMCPQEMCTLGFLATGAFQRELANRSGLCQSTLSRAMPTEWDGIICISAGISNSHKAVKQANIKAQFEARAGFPNLIRAIDCTHIV